MKSIACILIILVLCQSSALGAVSQGVFEDPKYPGKCKIRENFILSQGEEAIDPEECRSVYCEENSLTIFETCGVFVVGCGEEIDVNKTAPYPECCEPSVMCP